MKKLSGQDLCEIEIEILDAGDGLTTAVYIELPINILVMDFL